MNVFLKRAALLACGIQALEAAGQPSPQGQIAALDRSTPGAIGVFSKSLSGGTALRYASDRSWYLASTTKVLVAVVLLRLADRGQISLNEELTLTEADPLDGAGELQREPPGTRWALGTLLEKMIVQSDSTAADLLIRRIGVEELNRQVREEIGIEGFGPFTSLLQVRRDAYSQLHPEARRLTNRDFMDLKQHRDLDDRLQEFLRKVGIRREELLAPSIEEAFERYYRSGKNSGTLDAVGALLERLVRGELLSPGTTAHLLSLMERMETGEKRLKAGLPAGTLFAQKTGTQVNRMCNIGIVWKSASRLPRDATVLAVCIEGFHRSGDDLQESQKQAEKTLERVGSALRVP